MRPVRLLPAAAAGLLALSALTACEPVAAPAAVPVALPAPAPAPATPPPPEPAPPAPPPPAVPSAESEALSIYYRRLEADLLGQGLLRGDGGGPDAPFTDTMLARNFVDIALYDEYEPTTLERTAEPSESVLRRWDGPIRMKVTFGGSVGAAQAARDLAGIGAYAGRLSRLTGVPIALDAPEPNFHVLVLGEDEREGFGPALRALVPGIQDASVRAVQNLPRSTLCLVITFSERDAAVTRAVAVIRAEHPDLLRSLCIHEELAQGMGLANDSPRARPSIFNDDEEFALLTRHDEMLLRMLYDPRLRIGMSVEQAAPIARQIAAELMAGPS